MKTERILVPLDGSALAEAAIATAVEMARPGPVTLSPHGRGGVGRVILGSVAESVLRGTTTPILLLRAAEAPIQAPKGTGQARPVKEKSNV